MDNKTLPSPAQSSIRSFFKPKSPFYAPPPTLNPPKGPPPPPTTTLTAPPPSSLPQSATSTPLPPTSTTQQPSPPTTAAATTITTTTHPPIHPQSTISPILPSHIAALKRINALLLCITYPDSFYTQILAPSPPPSFSRAILWSASPSQTTPSATPPTLVGGVVCRLEDSPLGAPGAGPGGEAQQLYIQSLALLSPYRHLGLASAALNSIFTAIVTSPLSPPITSLYAHVWTENSDGLEWYKARGFEVEGGVVGGYYRRLSPDTAWVLRRRLGARDYLQYGGSSGTAPLANGGVVSTNSAPPAPPPPPPPSSSQTQQRNSKDEKENTSRPPPKTGNSYQNSGPGMEWNDLPTDILLPVPSKLGGGGQEGGSGAVSSASSRSSSVVGGGGGGRKKKRAYPAAAFGS
ncbi:hypothetical protein VE02_00950 [Pseudogymnoascus sp. 03VT05]|nr:hypothetical protein VE02_00950 [Pseudogymnoascus sp. 03VT05]